jgi:glutamyl-tRNA synthetase
MNSDQTQPTRTRFAPSPTGYIHVGNVRSALYPFLLARQARQNGDQNARFILRIEDTDQKRFVAGAEDLIEETLHWLGLDWDEGPELNNNAQDRGDFGPYHQTQRREIYHQYAEKLIQKGLAYADPYTPEQVDEFRTQAKAAKQPFLYRNFRPENPPQWDGSQPLRFRVPELKSYHWHDAVMGDLSAGPEALDDFILIKSDGLPTYNFAHIVDDHEMRVTHVIRGQEYIASMPKYLSLYDALEIDWPIFAHLPYILAPEGNKKLSKRDGAKSVTDYRAEGFLPEAMVNFLAQLGWNDGTDQDLYSLDELIAKFSLDRVQKSGARFDEKRLIWLNAQWIKRLSLDDLYDRTNFCPEDIIFNSKPEFLEENIAVQTSRNYNQVNWSKNWNPKEQAYCIGYWGKSASDNYNQKDEKHREVLRVVQDRLKTLADLPALTEYFFARPTPDWTMIETNKPLKKLSRAELTKLLQTARDRLAQLSESDFADEEILQANLNQLLETTAQKPAVLFGIIRLALTWAPFSPGLPETMRLLGKTETLARIDAAISA